MPCAPRCCPPALVGARAGTGSCGTFSCSDMGRSPFLSPFFPLPSAFAFLAGIPEAFVRGQASCCAAPRAERKLAGPCSLLTRHPHRPSTPLPAGTQARPCFMGNEEESHPLRMKHHVGWAERLRAGFAFPGRASAESISEVRFQV